MLQEAQIDRYTKITSALCQLAYGTPRDAQDEILGIAESTAFQTLEIFCQFVVKLFREEYLRKTNAENEKKSKELILHEVSLECLVLLIVLIGNGKLVLLHGQDSTLEMSKNALLYLKQLQHMSLVYGNLFWYTWIMQ
jgi:hypothetical protein